MYHWLNVPLIYTRGKMLDRFADVKNLKTTKTYKPHVNGVRQGEALLHQTCYVTDLKRRKKLV